MSWFLNGNGFDGFNGFNNGFDGFNGLHNGCGHNGFNNGINGFNNGFNNCRCRGCNCFSREHFGNRLFHKGIIDLERGLHEVKAGHQLTNGHNCRHC